MNNLFLSSDSTDFWVWINPDNWLTRHQITVTGGFTSGGIFTSKSNCMFIPNPDFTGDITPYQFGIMREYMAEYNLELSRNSTFSKYPSRLNAIYLFQNEEEANKYSDTHKWHVEDRILKRCHSVGKCIYSIHDSSWVDFLRNSNTIDKSSIDNVGKAYWSGEKVVDAVLESMGKAWSQEPVFEILFIGRVEFYDRNLER